MVAYSTIEGEIWQSESVLCELRSFPCQVNFANKLAQEAVKQVFSQLTHWQRN